MIKKIIYVSLVIIWCAVIFVFSGMTAAESGSRSKKALKESIIFSYSIAYKVGVAEQMPSTERIDELVNLHHATFRKLCHAGEFFVLSTILMFCVRKTTKLSLSKSSFTTFGICFFYCLMDEWHQIYVNGRAAMFTDCVIDTAGAILAILIYLLAKWINNLIKKE